MSSAERSTHRCLIFICMTRLSILEALCKIKEWYGPEISCASNLASRNAGYFLKSFFSFYHAKFQNAAGPPRQPVFPMTQDAGKAERIHGWLCSSGLSSWPTYLNHDSISYYISVLMSPTFPIRPQWGSSSPVSLEPVERDWVWFRRKAKLSSLSKEGRAEHALACMLSRTGTGRAAL